MSTEHHMLSGFLLNVGLKAGQLDINVGAPADFTNKTRGLIGVLNRDPSDDLLPANGSVAVNVNASERTIFYEFGETCEFVATMLEVEVAFVISLLVVIPMIMIMMVMVVMMMIMITIIITMVIMIIIIASKYSLL